MWLLCFLWPLLRFHEGPMKGLIVRTDSIGDLILTAPVTRIIKAAHPSCAISFLVSTVSADILTLNPDIDEIIKDDQTEAKSLRGRQFDFAIVLRPTLKNALRIFRAGIPVRIGTGYRAYSMLFNRRIYLHRKNSIVSELSLNCETVRRGLGIPGDTIPKLYPVYLAESDRRAVNEFLDTKGLGGEKYCVIHPFGKGSALYWPEENYLALAAKLWQNNRMKSIVIGSAAERESAASFVVRSEGSAISAAGKLSLKASAGLIESAAFFAGNSSGPIHIAAAMGSFVVGFYPPLKATNPLRWGPQTDRKRIFTPPGTSCDTCSKKCPAYGRCMALITVESVTNALFQEGLIP